MRHHKSDNNKLTKTVAALSRITKKVEPQKRAFIVPL